jgi:hypothetical protein
MSEHDELPEYVRRNRAVWDRWAPDWVAAGERSGDPLPPHEPVFLLMPPYLPAATIRRGMTYLLGQRRFEMNTFVSFAYRKAVRKGTKTGQTCPTPARAGRLGIRRPRLAAVGVLAAIVVLAFPASVLGEANKPAYAIKMSGFNYGPNRTRQTYYYHFDSWTSSDSNTQAQLNTLVANLRVEIRALNSTTYSAGANVPVFYESSASGVELHYGWTKTSDSGSLAVTSGNTQIRFHPIGDGSNWPYCELNPSLTPGSNCWAIKAMVAHEMGHVLGMGHTAIGGYSLDPYTIMHNSKPVGTSFGSCDIAGLEAIFGLASPSAPISTCLTPRLPVTLTLTPYPSASTASFQATMAPNTSGISNSVTWYLNATPESGTVYYTGLNGQYVSTSTTMELWNTYTGYVATMSLTNGSVPHWSVPSISIGSGSYYAKFGGNSALASGKSNYVSFL